jgi:hypothetical protein
VQRIFFCTGSTFYTGDTIAEAVMNHALTLAELRRFEAVELPVRRLDGSEGHATLLIGPSSQISTESVETNLPEVIDEELVDRLRLATGMLRDPLEVSPVFTGWEEDLVAGA